MSIYDRDYGRYDYDNGGQFTWLSPGWRSIVSVLILVNAILWFGTGILVLRSQAFEGVFRNYLSCRGFTDGFLPWQPLTSIFLHDPANPFHVIFNMLGLYVFGTDLERIYGLRRFLFLYLGAGILACLMFSTLATLFGSQAWLIGASGSIFGLALVFALKFPNILFFGFIKAWILVAIYILINIYQVVALVGFGPSSAIAHLTGATFGAAFFFGLPKYEAYLEDRENARKLKKVREREHLQSSVDQILGKINRDGMNSLTKQEKEILKKASDEMNKSG